METFTRNILRVADRHGVSTVFPDFLEMCVCALSAGAKEEHYLKVIKKYTKDEVYLLADACKLLVAEMYNGGDGLKDCLGDFFMDHLSFGRNGQFFTPQPLCDMMAIITGTTGPGKTVADCACGSGRTLLAAAKICRLNSFYGADIDRTCCLMAVINLCLNGMLGEVAWMDTLGNRFYGGWKIDLYPATPVPYVREITEDESYMFLKVPVTESKLSPGSDQPDITPIAVNIPLEPITGEVKQTSLWDEWTF